MTADKKHPPHEPGTRLGRVVIVSALEHDTRGLLKRQWWYEVRCDCGAHFETCNQNLREGTQCRQCANDQRARSKTKPREVEVLAVPDFARMRLSGPRGV